MDWLHSPADLLHTLADWLHPQKEKKFRYFFYTIVTCKLYVLQILDTNIRMGSKRFQWKTIL